MKIFSTDRSKAVHLSILWRWSPAGKGLGSWLSLGVFVSLSHMVFWVRSGTWLYRFLIFAFFLTLWRFRGGASFVDHFSYLCAMFVMLFFLFVAAWERAALLALLCVVSYCVFITFPYCDPGQVWFFIVSMFFNLCLGSLFSKGYNLACKQWNVLRV